MVGKGTAYIVTMKPYDPSTRKHTVIFSKEPVENLFNVLRDYIVTHDLVKNFRISIKSWKFTFTIENKISGDKKDSMIVEKVEIVIEFQDAGNKLVSIQFRRKAGSSVLFQKKIYEIREEFIKGLNNPRIDVA